MSYPACPDCAVPNGALHKLDCPRRIPPKMDSPLWKDAPAFGTQVGGDHYKTLQIQPVEYIVANELGYCEGNVVKYVSRWKTKGGVDDLRKAIHYLELLISCVPRS